MMKGMGLLSSLMGRKMGKMNGKDSSVSITIEKEIGNSGEMMGGGMTRYSQGGGLKMVKRTDRKFRSLPLTAKAK